MDTQRDAIITQSISYNTHNYTYTIYVDKQQSHQR